MSCHQNCDFTACSCIGVIISILFGAAIGVLYAFNFIPNIVTAVWITFGLAILTLVILVAFILIGSIFRATPIKKCLCNNTTCLLVGIIGTIISSLIALSITLTPTLISIITLIAIEAFFFAFMIIGLIALLYCAACRHCQPSCECDKEA